MELEEDVNLIIIPGDGHCIANCFATRFTQPLDKLLDLLEKEFRDNISTYKRIKESDLTKITCDDNGAYIGSKNVKTHYLVEDIDQTLIAKKVHKSDKSFFINKRQDRLILKQR